MYILYYVMHAVLLLRHCRSHLMRKKSQDWKWGDEALADLSYVSDPLCWRSDEGMIVTARESAICMPGRDEAISNKFKILSSLCPHLHSC